MKFAYLAVVLPVFLVGCGPSLKTHSVKGQVVLKNGNIELLRESHVEFESETDSNVRGSGLIAADGRFRVEMLHKGTVLQGLPAGNYRARLVLSDETPAVKHANIARRYLDFRTSSLAVIVPSSREIVIDIAAK